LDDFLQLRYRLAGLNQRCIGSRMGLPGCCEFVGRLLRSFFSGQQFRTDGGCGRFRC
jgi:hypothetical protein